MDNAKSQKIKWIAIIAILCLLVAGGAAGWKYYSAAAAVEYSVYGLPGQQLEVEDTGYSVTVDSFDSSTMTASITVTDEATGETVSGDISLDPSKTAEKQEALKAFGLKYRLVSTGWAADVSVSRNNKMLQSGTLCAGEHMVLNDEPDIVIALNAVYPDYKLVDDTPTTASNELKNPGYLYTIYYQNEVMGRNVLTGDDPVTIDDEYSISFDNPQQYVMLEVRKL